MMKIILKEDVPNLGVVGDLVSVKDGYARNYLIPQGKAAYASVRSIRELDHQKRLAAHQRRQKTAEAELVRRKIESLAVCMSAKVAPHRLGEDGLPIKEKLQKLFGSITTRDIAKVLSDSNIKVDHRRVHMSDKVHTVGKFTATIRLDGGVEANMPFWVIPEDVTDIEAEKKRVEAAQDAVRKEREAALREAALMDAQAKEAEAAAQAKAKEAAAAESDASGDESAADEGEDA